MLFCISFCKNDIHIYCQNSSEKFACHCNMSLFTHYNSLFIYVSSQYCSKINKTYLKWIKIIQQERGERLADLHFADDLVVMVEDAEILQILTDLLYNIASIQ